VRVAVLCEFSGIVRDAFIAAGHDAISCDMGVFMKILHEQPPNTNPEVIQDITGNWVFCKEIKNQEKKGVRDASNKGFPSKNKSNPGR